MQRDILKVKKFGPGKNSQLSELQCRKLLDGFGGSSIYHLYQKHGEMITVPPGTIHTVHNLEKCVKLAVEAAEAEHLCLYFQALLVHDNEFFGDLNPVEYLALPDLVFETARCIDELWWPRPS